MKKHDFDRETREAIYLMKEPYSNSIICAQCYFTLGNEVIKFETLLQCFAYSLQLSNINVVETTNRHRTVI